MGQMTKAKPLSNAAWLRSQGYSYEEIERLTGQHVDKAERKRISTRLAYRKRRARERALEHAITRKYRSNPYN